MSIQNEEKPLCVVYRNKQARASEMRFGKKNDQDGKKIKVTNEDNITIVTRQRVKDRFEPLKTEFQLNDRLITKARPEFEKSDIKNVKFSDLVSAVQLASEQDIQTTDKFVADVENMVTNFTSEFTKWQRMFESIKKRLPELQVKE